MAEIESFDGIKKEIDCIGCAIIRGEVQELEKQRISHYSKTLKCQYQDSLFYLLKNTLKE